MEIRTKGASTQDSNGGVVGFTTAITVILALIIVAILGQNVTGLISSTALKILSVILLLGFYVFLFYKPLARILDTPYLAISSLLSIAGGTAIGTFISQNALPVDFTNRYGEGTSKVLEFLQLDDVFHSWWYVGLFILMCGSLIKVSRRKGFKNNMWGFHLAHLSPIVILLGFWVDYYYGYRGIINLEVEQTTNQATVYKDHTNFLKGNVNLPFNLRLDNFEFEKHDPDYRLQVWKNEANTNPLVSPHGPSTSEKLPQIKATFPLQEKKIRKIYGTDVRFWMLDFYPNFYFDYSYPDNIDTIAPEDPGILLDLKTFVGEATLQLRQNKIGQDKLKDPNLGFSIEFYWDPPLDAFDTLENKATDTTMIAVHSAWTNLGKIILSGKERKIYFVKSSGITEEKMEKGKFYPISDKTEEGFTVKYLFPDAKYLQSFASSKNEKNLENPVAQVQVWGGSVDPAQTVYLYPGGNKRGGTFNIPGSDYFLTLESFREMETKFWKSDLSILDDEGQAIESKSIVVNEPFNYKGYRLYQSDYDPNNPKYSGIGVTYTPGLYIVYIGFILMVLGTMLLFYWKKNNNQL